MTPRPAVPGSLGQSARSGFKWGLIGTAAGVVSQLGFGAVMARLLEPADFGLVAMALVGLRLCSYLSQIGLSVSVALAQQPALHERDIRSAFAIVWLAGLVAGVLLVLVAPWIAAFFEAPALVPLLRALSLVLLLQGLAAVPAALLRRALRLREQAALDLGAYVLGYGITGVLAASAGLGVWSLVVAMLAQHTVALAGGLLLTRPPLRPAWDARSRVLLGYGARHTVIGFVEFIAASADTTLVARLLGSSALGLYNRALMLTQQPVDRITGILTRVLFPVLAAVQHDTRQVARLFLLAMGVVGGLGGAVSLAMSAAAPEVVALLLGPKWQAAAPLMQWLGVAVPLMFMTTVAGTLCDALALLQGKLRVQLFGLAAVVGCMLALSPLGVVGIAMALVLAEALRLAVFVAWLYHRLQLQRQDALRVAAAIVVAGTVSFVSVGAARSAGLQAGLGLWGLLPLEIATGALALAAAAWSAARLLRLSGPGEMARRHLPGWAALERVGLPARHFT